MAGVCTHPKYSVPAAPARAAAWKIRTSQSHFKIGQRAKTMMNESRYSPSGMAHSKGTEAISTERCAVTPINSAEGTSARASQCRRRKSVIGAWKPAGSASSFSGRAASDRAAPSAAAGADGPAIAAARLAAIHTAAAQSPNSASSSP